MLCWQNYVATVLTACGIETTALKITSTNFFMIVATVPTACGIETRIAQPCNQSTMRRLQQYLPLAVCDEGCEAAEE